MFIVLKRTSIGIYKNTLFIYQRICRTRYILIAGSTRTIPGQTILVRKLIFMYTQCLARRPCFIEVRYMSLMPLIKLLHRENLNNNLYA